MKQILYILLFIVSASAYGQIGPLPCGANSSITTWRQDLPYSIGQVVILNGVTYQSLTNNNINQNPCTFNGTQWTTFVGTSSGGGATFPGTSGIVFNTSTTASRNATSSDISTVLGFTPTNTTFPGTNGLVFNTSTTTSRAATSNDLITVLGFTPTTTLYPSTNGIVFNTSTTAARVATESDIVSVLGFTPTTTLFPSTFGVVVNTSTTASRVATESDIVSALGFTPTTTVFPGTSGIVFNTSTTASRVATESDIVSVLGFTPTTTVFPSTNGLVFNTSTTAGRNATSSDLISVLGFTPAPIASPSFTTLVTTPALNVTTGTAPAACGSATGCEAFSEASTAGTPTTGQDYVRADTTHALKYSTNDGSELILANGILGWHLAVAPISSTGLTANVAATTIVTPAVAAWYRLCGVTELTTAATTSSTLASVGFTYFSGVDGQVKFPFLNGGSHNATSNENFLSDTGCSGPFFAGTAGPIQYDTSGYASTGATAMVYDLGVTLEVLE